MTVIATAALKGSNDVELNTKNHLKLIDEAADAGAKLLVFPEVSLQGYPPDFSTFNPSRLRRTFESAERVDDGPHVKVIERRARERGIYVVYGLNEKEDSPGVIYNTAVLTGPQGFVGKYRKVHVGITEQLTWRKGDDWPVFQTSLGRIGMQICYDKKWPESSRELALRGADILITPTAWFSSFGDAGPEATQMAEHYELYDRVRAVENARWFISSNYVGSFGGAQFVGMSQIVDPMGRIVQSTGRLDSGLAIADVDIADGILNAHSMQGPRLVRDRMPATYHASSGLIPPAVDG
ncbi:carbon-nitrogen hydrolase family protein [Streptomyces sp. NPDC056227]|uniref:carbon-nitrogen hydrolase family protein n=1 Tax=unclassified Streptomyces TaxID=2593676 RepID=UPI0035E36510